MSAPAMSPIPPEKRASRRKSLRRGPSAKNLLVEFRHHSDERPIALHERGHEALICSAVMCGGNTPRGPKEFSNGSPLGPSLEGATLNEPPQGDGHSIWNYHSCSVSIT